MNLAKLMQGVSSLTDGLQTVRKRFRDLESTGEAGAGLVRVTMNGSGECVRVRIDPSLASDMPLLEDLVVAAQNQARAQLDRKMEETLKAHMSAMGPIPSGLPPRR